MENYEDFKTKYLKKFARTDMSDVAIVDKFDKMTIQAAIQTCNKIAYKNPRIEILEELKEMSFDENDNLF